MESLTVQERVRLKSVAKLIEMLRTQLIGNGFSTFQVQQYFTLILNDWFNNSEGQLSKYNLKQILTLILSKQKQNRIKALKKLQIIFHLQKISLQTQPTEEHISRKCSQTISDNIKQMKKQIKDKRKKQLKNQKNHQQHSQQNPKIYNSQISNLQPIMNIYPQPFKPLNTLNQSNNTDIPNLFLSNPFSTIKPQPQVKNIFTRPNQNDSKQELRKNIFEINFLKNILEKQLMDDFQDQNPLEGVNGMMNTATLMFKK